MNIGTESRRKLGALLALLLSVAGPAAEVAHFDSGLMRSYTATDEAERLQSRPDSAQTIESDFQDFLKVNFEQGQGGIEWDLVNEIRDKTHRHRLYRLTFGGRPVINQFVKLHYNHNGFVEFATSSWSARFLAQPFYSDREKVIAQFQKQIEKRYGSVLPRLKSELAFLVDDKDPKLKPVLLLESFGEHPAAAQRWIVDEVSGKTIDVRSTIRFHEPHPSIDSRVVANYTGTNNSYAVAPPSDGTNTPISGGVHYDLTVATALGADAATLLTGPYFEVRRARKDTTPVDVKLISNYVSGVTFNDPAIYNGDCVGSLTTDCPQQAFDAQNVHVHLSTFRKKMIDYLNVDLGITDCGGTACFPSDPVKVLVNAQLVNTSDGPIESNNAAFIPNCSVFGLASCLVFWKPAPIDGTSCGGTTNTIVYNLAREANVVVHEFQHYITDSITHIAFGVSLAKTVGDALHEGFSDYFAASHVVANSGGNTFGAKILGYAFKNCPTVIRDIAVLRPYQVTNSRIAHYEVGLTWASGLYQLRSEFITEYGAVKNADLLVLKSQFFLTPNPGYIEAVEGLVKADQALFSGGHVARIRALFYNELKFINGGASPFRNTESLVAEVGFRSCSSAAFPLGGNPWASLGALGLWLMSVLATGRAWSKRKEAGK